MSILDKATDAAVKKISGSDTIRIEPDQLAQMVYEEFISGADDIRLSEIEKVVTGKALLDSSIKSITERYELRVTGVQRGVMFGVRRGVWVLDTEQNKFYQIKDTEWKEFKAQVIHMINDIRINGRAAVDEPTMTTDTTVSTSEKAPSADRPIFCSQCGERYEEDSNFCSKCGAPRKQPLT